VKARNTTNPRRIANPVASTPNTPAARSPSLKKLPSGALRRTSSMAAIARPVVAPMSRSDQPRFIARIAAGRDRRGIMPMG
jgi:hypothetical protein